ncbi:MAG: type II toxin-antitoxin system death-on-curing family toxin [Caulobacteraceae bacterium]
MTDYLTVADVLAIHEDLIARYGGAEGVRDLGLLEAALFRPQTGYYPDLVAEAAALWESLSQNHPFIDGNKRAAFAATLVFLSINGIELDADADGAWGFLSEHYERGTFEFNALEPWLRANISSRN